MHRTDRPRRLEDRQVNRFVAIAPPNGPNGPLDKPAAYANLRSCTRRRRHLWTRLCLVRSLLVFGPDHVCPANCQGHSSGCADQCGVECACAGNQGVQRSGMYLRLRIFFHYSSIRMFVCSMFRLPVFSSCRLDCSCIRLLQKVLREEKGEVRKI